MLLCVVSGQINMDKMFFELRVRMRNVSYFRYLAEIRLIDVHTIRYQFN